MTTQDKLVLKHVFRAKPEVIFKAWTTPSLMERFLDGGCDGSDGVQVKDTSVDLRVGGRYQFVMREKYLHSGEYREINPFHRLVFTWESPGIKDSLVTVEIKPLGDRSEVTLTHERLPKEEFPSHTEGWTRIYHNLEQLLNS